MSKSEEDYKNALTGKSIPILTLDHKWHKLFAQSRVTPEIEALEQEVNSLLKRQGKINSEVKSMKALKKKLMDEIVSLADEFDTTGNSAIEKKIEEKKRLVEECNTKLDEQKDLSLDIPKELEISNYKLMIETMKTCRERLDRNIGDIEECDAWIKGIKEELRSKIICKQEKEMDTYELCTYMKNFFGQDINSIFEMKYNVEKFAPQKRDASKQ